MSEIESLTAASKAALRTSAFLDTIVRTARISDLPVRQTAIPCVKYSGRYKCCGFIKFQRQDIPVLRIQWSCNECHDDGIIADLKNLPTKYSNDDYRDASHTSHPIRLTRQEYQCLLNSDIYDPTCERFILEATPLDDGIQIDLPDDDVEYFMESIAPLCNHEKNKTRAKLLDSVFGKCLDLHDSLLELEAE